MREKVNQDIGWITMAALQPMHGNAVYKLLIIDDSSHDRTLYRRLLERSDVPFRIYECASVSEGLAISRQEKMDCIILDYRLPDGDGIDFIKAWQDGEAERDAAIIMVTGQGNEQTAVDAMKLGALDYIAKNAILEGYFVQSILNAIERSQLKRQIHEHQKELEKSYTAFSDFAHTVSHDLKAPLRRIQQYSKLLEQEFGEKLGQDGSEYISRLSINALRLHRLVDDLLAYSRTMNMREEKCSIPLKKIVDDAIENLADLIKKNKASVVIKELPHATVYPARMRDLFQNLIGNALKYHGKNLPHIEITCDETLHHHLISIRDNGLGIDARYHQSIFKPFSRLHSQDEIEGSGLGLSICKKVIDMHGGKIWVESQDGEGSCFKITLPK